MRIVHGIAVSPGIAIGAAFIIENERFRVPFRRIAAADIATEIARFEEAEKIVAAEIEERCDSVTEELGSQYGAIFMAHLQMLHDPQLHRGIRELVTEEKCSIEYAVSRTLRRYAQVFRKSRSQYMAERAQDVYDIEKLLLAELMGMRREELSLQSSPVILLSHELTPSETANLSRDKVLGFVTETGGAGGHVAIVAEALEIPAVVGTGSFLADVSAGELVIVDGDEGSVIIDPDEETLANYRANAAAHGKWAEDLEQLRELPAETLDGRRIQLLANIEFPHEAEICRQRNVEGIGLYRTEFLYLGNDKEPDEEDQFQAYRRVARAMSGRPVVIRTLDLGADKLSHTMEEHDADKNPFLGLRSIRLSLRYPEMFRRQLRAILRATTEGQLRIMFPLVSTLGELDVALGVLQEVKDELATEGVAFDANIPVGIMVEVPATVIMLDRFLEKVDFISIGTNDLVQYTLAVDRSNKEVASLYSNSDPAVLRLIQMACQSAEKREIPVSLCGQMSADPKYAMLLIGMGLTTLSIPPSAVPAIKRVCRSVTFPRCQEVADQALQLDTALEVREFLKQALQQSVPDYCPSSYLSAPATQVAESTDGVTG